MIPTTVIEDPDTGRAVRVRWIDSGLHVEGWRRTDAIVAAPPEVETVGLWLGESMDAIAIASTRGDEGAWLNVQVIWKDAVTTKEFLS